jgi:hypothetical protein
VVISAPQARPKGRYPPERVKGGRLSYVRFGEAVPIRSTAAMGRFLPSARNGAAGVGEGAIEFAATA